jgi:hypothetical protein
MVAPNLIWAGGDRAGMWVYDGLDWTSLLLQGRNRRILGIWIDPTGSEGWAVGEDGLVLRYR